jgi:hypothetical protein
MVFYFPATLDNGAHPGHAEGTEHHVFVDSKAAWEGFEDNLPRHAQGVGIAALEKVPPGNCTPPDAAALRR